jgi:integrase
MTGYERVLLYRLTVKTGLRRDEIASLRKSPFNFETCTVTVKPKHTKNKKAAILPLRKDTAAELQIYLSNKMPAAKTFNVPVKTANMIKEDLIAAGIPYVDDAGRFAE